MDENDDLTFQDAVEWADSLEGKRKDKRTGINVLYLILGAIVVIVLMILIIYLVGREPEKSVGALELMQNGDIENDVLANEDFPAGSIIEEYDPNTGETLQYEYVDADAPDLVDPV